MTNSPAFGPATFTPPQRRLLGGWRDILDDVRELSQCLAAMPEDCRCGDATAHVSGSCACCQAARVSCDDCTERLAVSRAHIDALVTDTLRFFPAFTQILVGTYPLDAQNAADEVQHDIGALVRTFERLAVATEAFSTGCRMTHAAIVKQAARDLHAHAEQLERLL